MFIFNRQSGNFLKYLQIIPTLVYQKFLELSKNNYKYASSLYHDVTKSLQCLINKVAVIVFITTTLFCFVYLLCSVFKTLFFAILCCVLYFFIISSSTIAYFSLVCERERVDLWSHFLTYKPFRIHPSLARVITDLVYSVPHNLFVIVYVISKQPYVL